MVLGEVLPQTWIGLLKTRRQHSNDEVEDSSGNIPARAHFYDEVDFIFVGIMFKANSETL